MQARDPQRSSDRWKSPEFWLVVALLVALMLAMLMIFQLGEADEKKDFLAIVLGAFGAWIGAGAAYFFGRENMREATESMLRMRGVTPQERLTQTAIVDLRPKPIPQTFKVSDAVETALNWFEVDPERFFIVVLNNDSKLQNVVHEEALYRYLYKLYETQTPPPANPLLENLGTVIEVITRDAEKLKSDKPEASRALNGLVNAAVVLQDRQTAFVANETMERERKFVTIVVNSQSMPIGYITTADIRRFVLSAENR
jgi:hypothetical protein